MGDEDDTARISASLGDLNVEVEGDNKEWVVETFEQQWADRLEESAQMKEAIRNGDVSTQ